MYIYIVVFTIIIINLIFRYIQLVKMNKRHSCNKVFHKPKHGIDHIVSHLIAVYSSLLHCTEQVWPKKTEIDVHVYTLNHCRFQMNMQDSSLHNFALGIMYAGHFLCTLWRCRKLKAGHFC